MVERDTRLGEVRDLTSDLGEKGSEAIGHVLEIARIRMFQGRFEDALTLLDSAVALPIYELADAPERARLLLLRAEVMLYRAAFANDRYDKAFEPVKEVEAMVEELADNRLLADARAMRAWILAYLERAAGRAREAVQEPAQASLDLRREIGDQAGIAQSLFLLAMVHEKQPKDMADEDVAKAEKLHREVLAITEPLGEKRWRSYATRHLGWISMIRGDLDGALPLFEESLRLRQEIGLRAFVPQAYYALGVAHLQRGELDEASAYCQEAYDLATELGNQSTRVWALLAIGEVRERRGEREEAMERYKQVLEAAPACGEALVDAAREAIERLLETS